MTLKQLKQIIDRALKEQPELDKTEVRFIDESGSAYLGALRLKETEEGYLQLALISKLECVTIWEPSDE